MTPIRPLRAAAAALLAGITGFAVFQMPASAAPAGRHAAASQPLTAAVTGTAPLTLGNGTQAVLDAPWTAAAGHAGRARSFAAAGQNFFCFFGAAQAHGPQAAPAQPEGPKYTLTIKGFSLDGAPAGTDGEVQVFSATSMKWNENTIGPTPSFRNGLVTMHVPAGKYWVIGLFTVGRSFRMDIPAQVTVTGSTTATVSARAANALRR